MRKSIRGKKCLICGGVCALFIKDLFDDRYGAPGIYSINRCQECGFSRIEPAIGHHDISELYAKYYPLTQAVAERVRKGACVKPKWKAWLTGTSNTTHWLIKPKSIVLDIGSADGTSLIEINQLKSEAYGIEPNPKAQIIAQKLKLRVFKGFITDNPFPGIKFDFITASQVIEHEPNPIKFLQTAGQHLDQNGRIILSFPNTDSVYRKIFGKVWINWHVPYHINFFTKKSFINLSQQSGFKVNSVSTITPNLWTFLQLQRIMTRSKEGEKNPLWLTNQLSNKNKQGSPLLKFEIILIKILMFIIMIPIVIINRTIDYFGLGDCFLVVLERDYGK